MAASRGLSWLKAVGVAAVVATPVAVTIEDWLFTVVKCKDALMQVRFGLGFEWSERAAARLDLEVSVGWVSASSRGMLGGELLRSWENRTLTRMCFSFSGLLGLHAPYMPSLHWLCLRRFFGRREGLTSAARVSCIGVGSPQ
jgi:hypothetical protein